MKKYAYYLPLISLMTGNKFVYQGQYEETACGEIILLSGEVCQRDKSFPA